MVSITLTLLELALFAQVAERYNTVLEWENRHETHGRKERRLPICTTFKTIFRDGQVEIYCATKKTEEDFLLMGNCSAFTCFTACNQISAVWNFGSYIPDVETTLTMYDVTVLMAVVGLVVPTVKLWSKVCFYLSRF